MTVGELKEFIKDLPDHMSVYIGSNDEQPVEVVVDLSAEIRVGCYSELYMDVAPVN